MTNQLDHEPILAAVKVALELVGREITIRTPSGGVSDSVAGTFTPSPPTEETANSYMDNNIAFYFPDALIKQGDVMIYADKAITLQSQIFRDSAKWEVKNAKPVEFGAGDVLWIAQVNR
jgi:hypothetical protein